MDVFKGLTAFVKVAEMGSFSTAAVALNTTQSTVSKQIAALEVHLGGALFERDGRRLAMTAGALDYLPQAHAALELMATAREQFAGERRQVSGVVRIAASWAFGRSQIIPGLAGLLRDYPGLRVNLRLSDQSVDLAREGIDVAFRVADLKDSSLVARRVGMAPLLLVGAPAYLKRRGRPGSPQDLKLHECIYFGGIGAPRRWRFSRRDEHVDVAVQGRVEANAAEAVLAAALQGLGLALLPAWMLREDIAAGRLEVLLQQWPLRPLPIHAVTLRSRRGDAMARAVIEHFAQRMQSELQYSHGSN